MDAQFQDTPIPGQQTLPGMAEAMGYETVALRPDQERFVWEYIRNGGHARNAYLAIHPDVKESTARSNSSKLLTNTNIQERIAQVREIIGNEWKRKIKDFHGRALEFDPAAAFVALNKLHISEMPEEIRKLCTLESRVIDGSVVYIPVFPDKIRAAQELAKMMGLHAAEKREISGPGGAPVSIAVEFVDAG